MAKEVLLYSPIYSYSAEEFVKELEANKNSDIVVRLNTPGGGVEDAWSAIAKFAEHKKNKLVKVDGKANSMGLFFLAYADDAEALDVSTFVLHRAAYPSWIEGSKDYMTDARWESLKKTNDLLRKALESKIDVVKFTQLKGVTLDQVFSTPNRMDVELTATEALAIGLIKRVNKITPELTAEIESTVFRMAAESYGIQQAAEATPTTPSSQKQNYNTMTLQELKATNPKLYAEVFQEGVNQEKDRVEACLVFMEVDPKGVKAAIEGGKPLSAKQMAEFSLKQTSPEAIEKLKKEAAGAVTTPEVTAPATEAQKEFDSMSAELDKKLGLKK